MKKIRVENINSSYSVIIVEKEGKEERHIVSNEGYFNLEWWIKKFEKENR